MSDGSPHDNKTATLADRVRSLQLSNPALDRKRSRGGWFPWLLCAVLATVSGYLGYRVATQPPEESDKKSGETGSTVPASAKPAAPAAGSVALEAGGYVIPVRKVQVTPKVGGEVRELLIEEGQYVKKGQVLARLDPAKYRFEHDRAEAALQEAKAAYEELKNGNRPEEIKRAEASLKEAVELLNQQKDEADRLERSGSASSPDERFRAKSRLKQAGHKVDQLQQELRLMQEGPRKEKIDAARSRYEHAEAQRNSAKYDLDSTEVKAPVDGIILVKRAELGNTVRPEAFSNGLSAAVCDMADLRDLEVDVDVGERDLARVFKGQKCVIRTEAFPDVVYNGTLSRLMPEAIRSKRSVSVRVRIQIPEGDERLRPELGARVQFLAKDKDAQAEKTVAAAATGN